MRIIDWSSDVCSSDLGGDGHPVTRHRCDAHRQCLGKYLQNSIGIVKLKYTRYPYFGVAWIATQDARAITRQFGREVGQTHFVRIQDPTNPLARTLWDRLDSPDRFGAKSHLSPGLHDQRLMGRQTGRPSCRARVWQYV